MNKGEEYVRQRGWRVSEITEGDRMSEQGAAPEIPEELRAWRQRWSHPPTLIPANATGLWYSEECVDKMLADYSKQQIAALTLERDTLKAKVARLSAPVSDEEWLDLCAGDHVHIADLQRHEVDRFIAARASTPPPHPINDDEQRRKDAAWNDRVKARCVCGEMIAWYSGEWLHVAGRSGLCADGRLASPAHFLVGRTPRHWAYESH